MHRFRNNVRDGWLFKQELRCFRNFVMNFDANVEDCDFFDIFKDPNNTSKDEAETMIASAFKPEELEKIEDINISFRKHDGKKSISIHLRNMNDILRDIWNTKELREHCRTMLTDWCDVMEHRKTVNCRRKDPMERRVNEIVRVIGLNDAERDVLIFTAVRTFTCFDDYPMRSVNGRRDAEIYYAMASDRPVGEITKAFSSSGKLRQYEVIDSDGDMRRGSPFREYLEGGDGDMLEGRFYRKAKLDDALPWDFFGKLAEEHGSLMKRMIRSANGRRPLNILLYGEPGTGKTSFAKSLAQQLGRDLFEIRQGDKDGENDSVQSRMTGIRICNRQVPVGSSMIMVDEADQLLRTEGGGFFFFGFGGRSSGGSEKGAINSILDDSRVPTIWISNAPAEAMADSVRRRFDYSVRFEKLSSRQRRSIWQNNIEKLRLGKFFSSDMVERLADRYDTNAGGITMVLENMKRLKPRKGTEMELIERLMKPHCELMEISKSAEEKLMPSRDYSLEGLNMKGDVPLERIVEAVRKFRSEKDGGCDPDRPRMNLLLWGPPGTGKTEFVKFLGRELNAKVVVKMGSDLLSMWVGGTEKNIRQAFAEAEEENAVLFLDEIDGLVQDRTGASRSWEVTQVNELLHQMENFKGVMVGATNFMDNLDQAILRRFTFKMQFDYLDEAGKRLFFERMFKTTLAGDDAERLAAIPNLAPGDYRTVRQSLYYLAESATNAQRISALENESSIKRDSRRTSRIGF